MTEKQVTIKNRAGIHARPAAMIVQTAGKFASRINMIKENETINAKSIMGIEQAVEALCALFDHRFEEE